MNQTTANVIIPSFDIKTLKPTIFSSFKLKDDPQLNVHLSDACIGTSAAPGEFPPYNFTNQDTEFNLVDGLFVASMPARLAVSEVLRHEEYKNREIILLSIGTGMANLSGTLNASHTWTSGEWLTSLPIVAGASSSAMNEYYLNLTFNFQPPETYLRIQEYNLDPSISPENASETNMDKLVDAGNDLLKEPVKRMNVDTFDPEETGEGTNEQALDKLAQILYEEKVRRLGKRASKLKRGFLGSLSATLIE